MIPRLGDGNAVSNAVASCTAISSLEIDSPSRGRKRQQVHIQRFLVRYLV